ncbi:thioredoxin [Clostridium sp. CAG:508]|jgi:thioredoxin 1|nr:thioredoxin [Clostridium sp. CAG:508]
MSVTELNKDNFEKEVMEANVPVLIDFWASWCGPCRMMSPVIDKIAEEMGDKLKVCKVNVDENHELAEKYEIMTIPAFIVIKNGAEAGRTIGVQPKEDILKLI